MEENVIDLFRNNPQFAAVLSIGIGILIAISGILPSVFLTAANILFFGFWQGTAISFLGETLGAFLAFLLYRKGFKKNITHKLERYPKIKKLIDSDGSTAFKLIFTLRLIPFIPSGLVTFAAAIGKVGTGLFVLASSLGKIPALLMEALAADQVSRFTLAGKIIIGVTALVLLISIIRNRIRKEK